MKWLNTFMELSKKPKVYVADQRTPEQEAMWQEQLQIQKELGMKQGDNHQNWLRLHQIMLDHEQRLTLLEGKTCN